MEEVFDYLARRGLRPKVVEGGEEAECDCPFCGKERHLSVVLQQITKEGKVRHPGLFHCKAGNCNIGGGFSKLRRKLGDMPNIYTPGQAFNKQLKDMTVRSSQEKSHTPSVTPPEGLDLEYFGNLRDVYEGKNTDKYGIFALSWLMSERCIPWATIEAHKIGFGWYEVGEKKRKIPVIAFPYYTLRGQLVNFKFRVVCAKDFGFKKDKAFLRFDGCESYPYGLNLLNEKHGAVILCEGEMDKLAYHAYGFENVVSLPDGANSWNHKWTPYLSPYEQIYTGYDNDEAGQDAAPKAADKIGRLRCLNVLLPLKDANECLMAGIPIEEIQKCFESAEKFPGASICSVREVEDLLVARLKGGEGTLGVSTGDPQMDNFLVGWRESEVTVVTGDTGMGKTTQVLTWAKQIARKGINTLYCPFELTKIQIMTKLVAIHGRKQFMEMKEQELRGIVKDIDANIPLYFFDAYGQIGIENIVDVVQYAARYLGIGCFILDPLQYALKIENPAFERHYIEQAMVSLQRLVKDLSIRIIVIVHPTKLPESRKESRKVEMDDLPGSARIKQDADNVIRIWVRPDETGALTDEVTVSLLKARSEFARVGSAFYRFNTETLEYIPCGLHASSIPTKRSKGQP